MEAQTKKWLDDLTHGVLLSDKFQDRLRIKFREKYGFGNLEEFISVIAEKHQTTEEEAKRIILDSSRLVRLAFILA